tara:strand:- start:338 stop:607 length:270 start_codon:yes stop_codon:yes gene_type:complete
MDFKSDKVCKVVPKNNSLDIKKNKLKEILEFYKDVTKPEVFMNIEKDLYQELISKGEMFKSEIKINLSDEEYQNFSNYLNDIKNLKYLF